MEVAVTVIQSAGIQAVLARSFARSFYRNAMNNGLVVVECDTSPIVEGDGLVVSLGDEGAWVRLPAREVEIPGAPIPSLMRRILEKGGLVPFLRDGGELRAPTD